MKAVVACLFCATVIVESVHYDNVTDIANEQLMDFKRSHPVSIGLWTKASGDPTEIRDIMTINSDQFNNQLLLDSLLRFVGERIPERVVHAKGTGAFGYFEVTHDVSKYTYAEVFNGVGKKTPLVVRFSTALQNLGGTDFGRELRGMAIKMYTKEGNLDFTCLQTPVYLYRDPKMFLDIVHAFKRNPQTSLFDFTAQWDLMTLRPVLLHNLFYTFADFGIPDGYRRIDAFPIHTYEIANKHGERHYVRFNFRTEQGFSGLTTARAEELQSQDPDYFNRDLYNAIAQGNYPAWKLEMDVMTVKDIQKVDFDPFDVTRLWKNGTFFTVQIGRLVLNKNVENQFRDIEEGAFNPAHLVPGIPGPVDFLFKGRRVFYRDTQNYRIGRNHNKAIVNRARYAQTYNRDGNPPLYRNGRNSPNYYPNSFSGAAPYVDEKRPSERLQVLESTAVDFEPLSTFYNHILEDEAHRQRFVNNIVDSLLTVSPPIVKRGIKTLYLIDRDLGKRVAVGYEVEMQRERARQAANEAARAPPSSRRIPSGAPPPDHGHQKFIYDTHGKGDK